MHKTILFLLFILLCFSCDKTTYINNDDMLINLENDLKKRYGTNTYYTDIIITLNNEKITNIDLTQTKNPESLKMEGWNYSNQEWNLVSEVSLKLSKGEIKDYMFQLGDDINLEKINQFKQKVPVKEDFYLSNIKILAPENGNKTHLKYQLQVQQKSNNKKFEFNFDKDGNLVTYKH